jgi:hypothetical protein
MGRMARSRSILLISDGTSISEDQGKVRKSSLEHFYSGVRKFPDVLGPANVEWIDPLLFAWMTSAIASSGTADEIRGK